MKRVWYVSRKHGLFMNNLFGYGSAEGNRCTFYVGTQITGWVVFALKRRACAEVTKKGDVIVNLRNNSKCPIEPIYLQELPNIKAYYNSHDEITLVEIAPNPVFPDELRHECDGVSDDIV